MQENLPMIIIGIMAIMTIVSAVVTYIKRRRKGEQVDPVDYFLSLSPKIVELSHKVITVLSLKVEDFESEKAFEEYLLKQVLEEIDKSSVELGLNKEIINIFNKDDLASFIYRIIHENKDKMIEASKEVTKLERAKEEMNLGEPVDADGEKLNPEVLNSIDKFYIE